MNTAIEKSRGAIWLAALTGNGEPLADYPASVRVVDAKLTGNTARFLAVVPYPANRFSRARHGEVGLIEGWELARAVNQVVAQDRQRSTKTPIVAIIDVISQAYGRAEEALGIHQALAGAADAYATARIEGHPVIGLIVGSAMSGAFLAHGYQANRLIAISDSKVMVHAMGKESAARITMRSVEALESLAATIPPMAYDIDSYATLGLLSSCLKLEQPDAPTAADIATVKQSLQAMLDDILKGPKRDLACRLGAENRKASSTVRDMLRAQWSGMAP